MQILEKRTIKYWRHLLVCLLLLLLLLLLCVCRQLSTIRLCCVCKMLNRRCLDLTRRLNQVLKNSIDQPNLIICISLMLYVCSFPPSIPLFCLELYDFSATHSSLWEHGLVDCFVLNFSSLCLFVCFTFRQGSMKSSLITRKSKEIYALTCPNSGS